MKQNDAYKILRVEYLSKCDSCDECIAEYFCIKNGLRNGRQPQDGCDANLRLYLEKR